jgi:hypothetical protein
MKGNIACFYPAAPELGVEELASKAKTCQPVEAVKGWTWTGPRGVKNNLKELSNGGQTGFH